VNELVCCLWRQAIRPNLNVRGGVKWRKLNHEMQYQDLKLRRACVTSGHNRSFGRYRTFSFYISSTLPLSRLNLGPVIGLLTKTNVFKIRQAGGIRSRIYLRGYGILPQCSSAPRSLGR
jgi:hypothetical protein